MAGIEKIRTAARLVDMSQFKKLLLQTCGHSFEKEREQALSAAISRRMTALGINLPESYYSLLTQDQGELLTLTELLTVNETYFFREPEHLTLMVDTLLPGIMSAGKKKPVRILSAGCSTGEEPYSIAIMLRERYGAESENLFAITGVDIDSTVIAKAKQGIYGKSSFRGMDKNLYERYFKPLDTGRFQVNDAVRSQVAFEVANLLGPSYPQRMQLPDIILYRNVSIYFPGQIQREIFSKLAELLVDGGCLLVGASETIYHDLGILSLTKENSLFFYRKAPPLLFEERRASARLSAARNCSASAAVRTVPVSDKKVEALKSPAPGRYAQELRSFNNAPRPTVSDVKERFNAAIEMAHNKQYDQALAALDLIIQNDKLFEKAYCLKGSLLLNAGRFDEAATLCEELLKLNSLSLEAYLMLGMIARQHGDNENAIKRFREAIYLDSSCWLAHFYSAEICFAQKDEKRARNGYETALMVLEKGSLQAHGQDFFPLSFNAEQFMMICRHKLSMLAPSGGAGFEMRPVNYQKTTPSRLQLRGNF